VSKKQNGEKFPGQEFPERVGHGWAIYAVEEMKKLRRRRGKLENWGTTVSTFGTAQPWPIVGKGENKQILAVLESLHGQHSFTSRAVEGH